MGTVQAKVDQIYQFNLWLMCAIKYAHMNGVFKLTLGCIIVYIHAKSWQESMLEC